MWNYFLARKKELWETHGTNLSAYDMIKELPALKNEYPWLQQADSQSLQQTVRDLDQAYRNFFRRVKNGHKPGFPRFKRKYVSKESFRVPQRTVVNVKHRTLSLPKHGTIKFRDNVARWRGIRDIRSVTISVDGN